MENIAIQVRRKPSCPSCGSERWLVRQKVERESELIKVDGFSDLEVEIPSEYSTTQTLAMLCLDCGECYGVAGKHQAYFHGGEDGLGLQDKMTFVGDFETEEEAA